MAEEVVIGIDRSGKEATVLVNENGYVELFRATDNPERLVISDFTKQGDIQSAGLGTQNYFATNAPYANKYTGTNKKLYKFSTNIKPNEILDISPVSLKNKHPELYTLIFGENEIRNTKAIQDNIETIKELGYKAIGNRETGSTGLLEVAQYEIIPLTTANETYNIKPIATLQTKEGFAAGKSPEAFIETSLDTPTNVVGNIYDDAIEIFDTSELLTNGKLEHSDLTQKLLAKNYEFEEVENLLNDIFTKQMNDNPQGFENISKDEFIKYADTPTNVVHDVVVTSASENLKQTISTNADGNIVLYRATTNPNANILSDFTDINMSNQAGLGQQSFYAIDEMYSYNYSRPSINKNVYKYETNIKPNQVLNIQSPTNAQLDVLEKINITAQDLENWDIFNTGEVNKKIQNNLDYLLENNIKAIGNNKVGGSPGVFDYEIVPIITEKTQTQIKPVSQLILDPNWEGTDRILNVENELFQSTQSTQWAGKYLPIDVNDPNTKYRPVYYIDEEGIGRKARDFQFSEQQIENNLVKDNLIEVPVDTNTNVNLVNDTYVLSTDTPTNVVDDVNKLNQELNTKYADVIDNDYGLNFELRDGRLHITDMYLKDAERGKGIGSEIFDEIKQFADNNNLEISLYNDGDFNTTFWENKGFQEWSSKNNVDFANTPDDKLGLFILDADTPTNVVGDEFVDNIVNANTQLVNDLPLSETVKNQFDNVVKNRAKNLATPGGVIDAVDVWEMGVLGLMITAIAYKEFDEIPTIFKRTATNMFNSMTSMYNIPPVPLEQYDLDYEFIEKVITTGEKVMPTDIIIKKVGEIAKGVGEKGLATGFGYVPTTLKNTDTMETTQKIQPGVQEEKMFEQLRPKKTKSAGGSGARIQ